MKECWLHLYRTLNHEKMFERKSWERIFLLKPKTPQIKELVPEKKEAWSKRETKYQLPLLPKCTPSLCSNVLSRKATERTTLFFHSATPTKGAIMHENYSEKLSALVTLCSLFLLNEMHMNRNHIFVGPLVPFFLSFFLLLTEADIFLKASLMNGVITEYSATLLSRFRRLFQYSFP